MPAANRPAFNPMAYSGPNDGNSDWIGTDVQWGGLYITRQPYLTTIVIPYGFVAIPLTLLTTIGFRRLRIAAK